MLANRKSVMLLGLLSAVILFLIGFRWGKQVERADKSYVPPPTTTPLPTPSPLPPSFSKQIKTFSHAGCSVEFLYPKDFSVKKNSSQEAQLVSDSQQIYFTCAKVEAQDQKQYEAVLNVKTGQKIYFKVTADIKEFIVRTILFPRVSPLPKP